MSTFISIVLVGLSAALAVEAAVVAYGDARYVNWQPRSPNDPTVQIPVYIEEAAYAGEANCLSNIKLAITQMNADLAGCISFSPLLTTPNSNGLNFIWISTKSNTGVVSPVCTTVPGRDVSQNGNGQKLYIGGQTTTGIHNCCGTVRDVMRYLSNVVGLRNEFLRPDRPITTAPGNVHPSLTANTPFTAYTAASFYAVYNPGTIQFVTPAPAVGTISFDYNSVTMVDQTKYSANGAQTWTVTAGQQALPAGGVGTQAHLSTNDCNAIHVKYSCPAACPAGLPLST